VKDARLRLLLAEGHLSRTSEPAAVRGDARSDRVATDAEWHTESGRISRVKSCTKGWGKDCESELESGIISAVMVLIAIFEGCQKIVGVGVSASACLASIVWRMH